MFFKLITITKHSDVDSLDFYNMKFSKINDLSKMSVYFSTVPNE